MTEQALKLAQDKMRARGVAAPAIEVFSHYHRQVASGVSGMVPEDSITPLSNPTHIDDLNVDADVAAEAFAQTAIIKLNGGLGTSMGLAQAKTLLPVRGEQNFLDVLVQQVQAARREHRVRLPLLFMTSFRTSQDTLDYLSRYTDLAVDDLPLDFLQNSEPKLVADTLEPVSWPSNPELEWCPPGHGDVYTALEASGVRDALIERGFRYVSISNGDNLGARPDPQLAGWFATSGAPFAAEVCERTVNDRKGGHLAVRRSDGRIILREIAQTPANDQDAFGDITRHCYFNTNNLWVDLYALRDAGSVLGLPLIVNRKTVDPTDPHSTPVIQLETAMGAAIEVFEGAQVIQVGRDRFVPVKTTNELLLLRSDLYELTDEGTLVSQVVTQPKIDLDARYYGKIGDFLRRVPVVPSLVQASSVSVRGDWTFDQPVELVGDVVLNDTGHPERVPAGRLGEG